MYFYFLTVLFYLWPKRRKPDATKYRTRPTAAVSFDGATNYLYVEVVVGQDERVDG